MRSGQNGLDKSEIVNNQLIIRYDNYIMSVASV
jgi:hypothetical protein